MATFDIAIIGGGIVGLATATKILEENPGLKLCILEKERDVAKHQTGNNSGVIHAGIYYQPGSAKAVNCRKGYHLLLDFCDKHEVQYEICGKVIVATNQRELPYLDVLLERGKKNGLTGLKRLSADEINEYEPHARGVAGIHVPQTGIINFIEVAQKLRDLLKKHDVQIYFTKKVLEIRKKANEVELITAEGSYTASFGVNCAGLFSDRVTRMTNPDLPLRIIPFRGEYYKLREDKKYLVKSLIYPVPDPAFPFLGVHFTRTIDGQVEAGPNAVLALKREGYKKTDFDLRDIWETVSWPGFLKIAKKYWRVGFGEMYRSLNKQAFVNALQQLVPEITAEDLVPGGAGVRAQACHRSDGLLDDFYTISEERFFHVCNAPSPAATSCLSIGESISQHVLSHLN